MLQCEATSPLDIPLISVIILSLNFIQKQGGGRSWAVKIGNLWKIKSSIS